MNPTFEVTIQRCLEFDVFPVVAELSIPDNSLPQRAEGRLTLSAVDMEELAAKTRAAIQQMIDAPPPPHGRLRILGEPGALVWLDERLVGVLPLAAPLLLSPDEHRLRIEQRGGSIESPVHVPGLRMAEARVSPGDSTTLVVELLTAVLLVLDGGMEGPAPSQSTPKEFTERLSEALEDAHLTLLSSSASVKRTPRVKHVFYFSFPAPAASASSRATRPSVRALY